MHEHHQFELNIYYSQIDFILECIQSDFRNFGHYYIHKNIQICHAKNYKSIFVTRTTLMSLFLKWVSLYFNIDIV